MSSGSKKSNGVVDTTHNKRTTSTKPNVRRRRIKNSEKKPDLNSLIKYLKNTEKHGISLYTHVRMLIDLFVFQNPIQPIRHFEYYSEKVKECYRRPRHDFDTDFLNNIELEVCEKITNIRRQIVVSVTVQDVTVSCDDNNNDPNEQNNKINTEEDHRPGYPYGDDDDDDDDDGGDGGGREEHDVDDDDAYLRYGDEGGGNYYSHGGKREPDDIVAQDLPQINRVFNKAGCGITDDEAYLIETTVNHLSNDAKFRNIRYWGKILGLKRDYYVLECEWQIKEIEYRLRALNYLATMTDATFGYDNMYEGEGPTDELDDEMFFNEQSDDEYVNAPNSIPLLPNVDSIDERTARDSDTFDCDLSKSTCFPLSAEQPTGDQLRYEMFGFGANKKSYFVTNEPYGEWIELPPLMPHHVIQSRNIKRHFVGDLNSPVESYPPFQGSEKHYLRAQIARITAETRISPRGYFSLGGKQTTVRTNRLTPFQSRVLSRKYVHDYAINENYEPPSVHALLQPKNWVHHTPPISDGGVTNEWTEITTSEEHDGEEQLEEERRERRERETAGGREPAGAAFATVADGPCTAEDRCPPWTFRPINPFDRRAAYVSATSNVWPGAYAVAGNRLSDCTYYGWGHGRDAANGIACLTATVDAFRSERPSADAWNTTEAKDPTRAEQLSYVERMRAMRDKRLREKNTVIAPLVDGVEEEERVLSRYNYD